MKYTRRDSSLAAAFMLLLMLTCLVAGPGVQTDDDLPLHFKDKRLEIRGTNIHEYNIEAIWEKIAGK